MDQLEIIYKDGHTSNIEIDHYEVKEGLLIFEHTGEVITHVNLDVIKEFSVDRE